MRQRLKWAVSGVAVLAALWWIWGELDRRIEGHWTRPGEWWGQQATLYHYDAAVRMYAAEYALPPAYLLALIQLESGGRKPAGKRFEAHVFERLKAVRDGKKDAYEQITAADLAEASDDALRNLATSWGPFQLMGYKCIQLDVQLRDIRGKDAVKAGVRWIDLTYGDVLRAGQYPDAFHLHNTGKPLPKDGTPTTFHPDYIERGMRYMRNFDPDARE